MPEFGAPEPVNTRALLNADWVSVERFDFAEPDKGRLYDYLDSGEAERILLAGAKHVRLAARTKAGPQHVSDRPTYMLLIEWPERPCLADVGKRLSEHFGAAIAGASFFVGYRLYPWVDRKDVLPR